MTNLLSPEKSKLVFGAHQDDLEIASGGLINKIVLEGGRVSVVYTTNGAPNNPLYYPRWGISEPTKYSELRRAESLNALSKLGLKESDATFLDFPDQSLIHNLDRGIEIISSLIESIKPAVIITPAYEGGHPDHDATRFMVEESLKGNKKSENWEYTEYNLYNGQINLFKFLEGGLIEQLILDEQTRRTKMDAFECFVSQRKYIDPFLSSKVMKREQFRRWRREDFTSLPHERPLHYETVNIKVNPEDALQKFREYLMREK